MHTHCLNPNPQCPDSCSYTSHILNLEQNKGPISNTKHHKAIKHSEKDNKMKRDQQNLDTKEKEMSSSSNSNPHAQDSFLSGGSGSGSGSSMSAASGGGPIEKGKMWDVVAETHLQDAGVDELLYALGYRVKSSDMAEVANKIELLEEFMGNVQDNYFSDTDHYNPSDLSSWLESMISVANPDGSCSNFVDVTSLDNNSSTTNNTILNLPNPMLFDDSSFDSVGPGRIAYPPHMQQQQQQQQRMTALAPPSPAVVVVQPPNKRMKPNSQMGMWGITNGNDSISTTCRGVESTRPIVLVDSQENGIKLVHALMACAEAIQQENIKLAEALVKQIGILALSQAGAMRKVATYYAEALARRIYRLFPTTPNDCAFTDLLEMHYYETCPYLKFAHFTANQAILEAFAGKTHVHVIDFSMKQGMQWPALLQALTLRPGGPPSFRLTGIGPPSDDNTDHLQEVGWKLAQLAESINVAFEYRGFVATSLADLNASMFDIRENETVAVNSIFELHQLLARPGAIEKVLSVVSELKPEILTVVEQEGNHNGPVFHERFTESLQYYSTMFDSLEGSNCCNGGVDGGGMGDQEKVMSEVYLGRQICNLVACEGMERVERHETLLQWRKRLNTCGFVAVHLGSNAFKQASMLLALFAGGDGYKVEENDGCLMLGWHTRPLITTSAWKLLPESDNYVLE